MKRFNILLVTPDLDHAEMLANPLRISRHEVCTTYGPSGLYSICKASNQQGLMEFDLVIADVAGRDKEMMNDLFHNGVMRALLFVDCDPTVLMPYVITANKGVVYRQWALLAAVREIIRNCEKPANSLRVQFDNSVN